MGDWAKSRLKKLSKIKSEIIQEWEVVLERTFLTG